jgi:hypothetical protein
MVLPVKANYRFIVVTYNAIGGASPSARSNLVTGR